jgi:hypothetical protein
MKTKPIKYPYYWLALSMCIGISANAQKLPNVQTTGLYAPVNIKIDGKAAEWGSQLQAYNKTTSLFYTLANSNDNLYLTIQAADKTTINKMLGGGLTLLISSKDKNTVPVSITTPILPSSNRAVVTQKTNSKDPLLDTDLPEANKAISSGLKEMAIKGITAIPDSAISVYNEYGIKVAAQLDISKAYTCELVIPLKYINQLTSAVGTFNYNITLNGIRPTISNASPAVVASMMSQMPAAAAYTFRVDGGGMTINGSSINDLMSSTDFSGTYTLIKK